ncbi:hypothetical protein HMPREF0645_1715 [Hallella bergensis DSM 17361]|uniref:Uncharacterized protein n=1 Tax=Hallella bergensis DSM 17361 TaxID=585502 RepID=D1PXN0_9BACT|nr:hypothetical protein HMPREF0645_1715 [Hallella bergensis DSM 17361]
MDLDLFFYEWEQMVHYLDKHPFELREFKNTYGFLHRHPCCFPASTSTTSHDYLLML